MTGDILNRSAQKLPVTRAVVMPEPVHQGRGSLLLDGLLAALTGLALLFPLLLFGTQGFRLSGMGEESVGYRYFYSLRILYTRNERPWLPQGQLIGLVHEAIQYMLTSIGHPPSELYPRIELFSYVAASLPLVLAVPAFLWAVRPLSKALGKVLLALAIIAVSYEPRAGGGYHLAIPDYYSWVIPLGLITLGWALRALQQEPEGGFKRAVLLGTFAGCCLAVKPTYCILALIVGIVLCFRSRSVKDAFALSFAAPLIAVQVSYLITLLYYRGSNAVALLHFEPAAFEGLRDPTASLWDWLQVALLANPPDATKLALVWPVFLTVCLIYLPRRLVTLSLLPSAILTLVLAFERFYPPTLIELNIFWLTGAAIWMQEVGPSMWQALSEWAREQSHIKVSPVWMGGGVVLALGLLVAHEMWTFVRLFQPCYAASTQASLLLDRFLSAHPGRTLFLVPDNNFRPTTVDSSIYKGGANLSEDLWENGAFVPSLFPNRDYIIGKGNPAIRPDHHDTLVYVALRGRERDPAEHQQPLRCPPGAFQLLLGSESGFGPGEFLPARNCRQHRVSIIVFTRCSGHRPCPDRLRSQAPPRGAAGAGH